MRTRPRRSIRSMSQRPKGPGGPPTSSTIPSWSLPHLPEPGLTFNPCPQIRDLPTLHGARWEPVLVSVHLSVLPAGIQPRGLDRAWPADDHGSLAAPPVLPCPPHPVQCLRGCSMFCVFLNQDPKATAPCPTPTESLRAAPPESPTPLPRPPQNLFFFLTKTGSQAVPYPSPSRSGPSAGVVCVVIVAWRVPQPPCERVPGGRPSRPLRVHE